MRNRLAVLAAGMVTLVAVLVAAIAGCSSGDDGPTNTPGPTFTFAPTPTGATAKPSGIADAYLIYHDDTGALAVRNFASSKTYRQPIDGNVEVVVQTRCTSDGSKIAYLKQVFAQATQRQLVIRGAGAPAEPIIVSSLVQWFAWSPDGSEIAVVEWNGQAKHAKVYSIDVATGAETTILEIDQYVGNLAWSPLGDKLTFYLQSPDFRNSAIYTVNIDGSSLTRMVPEDTDLIWLDPAWSPDGTYILAAGAAAEAVQLYKIDLLTHEVTQLTQSDDIYKRNPYFSPDGSIVAYTGSVILPGVAVNWAALHQFAIFTMNPDGSDDKALTADPRGTTPGPNDPFLNAYLLGWCPTGPWLDDLWEETQP